jgi:hypothetical protein
MTDKKEVEEEMVTSSSPPRPSLLLLLWSLGECHNCKSHLLWIPSHESFDDFNRFGQQLFF